MATQRVSFLRHSGWISPEQITDTLHIVGCGAVGSNVALLAAKMGFTKFEIWDADVVEPHNLSNQAYDVEHLFMNKVDALEHVLTRFNPEIKVTKHAEFFTMESELSDLGPMVMATDSMKSRAMLGEWLQENVEVEFVFDTRLGFDFGIVHIFTPFNSEEAGNWSNTLRDDSEVPEGPCNRRMCTTLVWQTASFTVNQLCRRYVADKHGEQFVYPKTTFFEHGFTHNIHSMVDADQENL